VVSLATGAMAITLLVASVISDSIGRRQMMAASLFCSFCVDPRIRSSPRLACLVC